jgi:hypothetical protein
VTPQQLLAQALDPVKLQTMGWMPAELVAQLTAFATSRTAPADAPLPEPHRRSDLKPGEIDPRGGWPEPDVRERGPADAEDGGTWDDTDPRVRWAAEAAVERAATALAEKPYLERLETMEARSPQMPLLIQQAMFAPVMTTPTPSVLAQSPAIAKAAAARARAVIAVHSSLLSDPTEVLELQRTLAALRELLGNKQQVVQVALLVEGASTAEEAEAKTPEILRAIHEGSKGLLSLEADEATLLRLPAEGHAARLVSVLHALNPEHPEGLVVIGPRAWVAAMKRYIPKVAAFVVDSEVVSGGALVRGAVEAVFAGEKALKPVLTHLRLFQTDGLFFPRRQPMKAAKERTTFIHLYREAVKKA